jgi:hypothetical protein
MSQGNYVAPNRGLLGGRYSDMPDFESDANFERYFLECDALAQYECYLKCEFEALRIGVVNVFFCS